MGTKYEAAFKDAAGAVKVLGYLARKSAIGLLEFVQSCRLAQNIVEAMPDDVNVARKAGGWTVTTAGGDLFGRFYFTGRTAREAGAI